VKGRGRREGGREGKGRRKGREREREEGPSPQQKNPGAATVLQHKSVALLHYIAECFITNKLF